MRAQGEVSHTRVRCMQEIEITAGNPVRRENCYYREESIPGNPVRRENWSTRVLQAGCTYTCRVLLFYFGNNSLLYIDRDNG
jgi:hypothetical protein